ncbi:helicase-related protein [Azospirillum griseum]|uniref:RNA helicase n=1 Tax=Azospirillum griseum TaxID=2496639 RepID=A0A431VNN7_9PROT|nr:helicase-related protein [Azospirillum griseum]RTR24359.1 RNA helicase [Azospirillum griseum]
MTDPSTTDKPDADGPEADPHLVHDLAMAHPEVTTLAAAGLLRMTDAEGRGLVALGLPLPKGKRDLLVPADRRAAILLEIQGRIDRAHRRDALLAQGRRALAGRGTALLAADHSVPDHRTRVRAVREEALQWPGLPTPVRLQVSRSLDALELDDLDDATLAERLERDPTLSRRMEDALSRVAAALRAYADDIGDPPDEWGFPAFADRLARAARNRLDADDLLDRWEREHDQWRRDRAEGRGHAYVRRHFDLSRFEGLFPMARGLTRKLVLVIGPTNSGKTHHALSALRAARDGVYLAPLRLLALEVMERLNADQTPTTLVTGEEEIRTPGARHTASTIELMDPNRPVAVAVIDEIQMLADPERGWAWTAALIGVPAETVYILGAPEVRPLVERAAAHLGETLEVVELERKAPLSPLPQRLDWPDVEPGDALIAFSRREVHSVRDTLLARGLTVAAVYGALAPAVRRREAARFLSGEADVVVATDAIGMGMNLPCRRVLFTALEKFDGASVRPLTATEIKQIAGRAGRFGQHEEGFYGVIGRGTPQALRQLLEKPDSRLRADAPLPVRPSRAMLARLADHVGTAETRLVIDCFVAGNRNGGGSGGGGGNASPFRLSDLSGLRRVALLVDSRRLTLDQRLDLLLAPADLEDAADARVFAAILDAIEQGEVLPLGRLLPDRLDGLEADALEAYSRACDLYFWAARKFPDALPDRDRVRAARDALGQRLSEKLSSRARRREPPPAAGFRGAPRKRFGPKRR